ncbi:cation-translocating P-type ATPase [Neobacillus niacini]|uniref:heavy metal translocating P-type ATPase n=1 Tax=Neobacillus niacini TaxID=86668 RepID=UPI00285DABAE|nr:cation-translocating P-type ATPase [Neobacillus niacini]MDR6997718.1 Cd2+/Zn2+-exporting ATPase [Neobacillus niacini]
MNIIHKHKSHITLMSGILIAIGFTAGRINYDTMQTWAFILATLVASFPIVLKAWQSLRMKVFSIEFLVSMAVVGALYIHEFTESSVVTFLFLFGDYLEARTLEKTRSSLKGLVEMAPKDAMVIRDGCEFRVPIEEVNVGDIVMIRSGGKVPVDGTIISGQGWLNEASITGESVQAMKKKDDPVFSGTILDHGYLEVLTEKAGPDTTFAKMIELVEEAQEAKTKTEKFLDKFSSLYTTFIVLLSIIFYVLTKDLHTAITFLVIACPGALVIGAPVSNVTGIGNGAKHGVLVKGGEVLERFSKVDTFIFDKTGTLTKGKPEVTEIKLYQDLDPNEFLRWIAQVEAISEHHLGQAIVNQAKVRNINITGSPVEGEILKGKGIRAKMEGKNFIVGNRKLMEMENIRIELDALDDAVEHEKAGNTAIFAAVNGELAGTIYIIDQIREDALPAFEKLREKGIRKIIMLTGDNKHTAQLVAKQLRLEEYHAELLPQNKLEYVKKLKEKGHVVAMVGDGINDAPSIAAADIGVAMGKSGTDISIETADVVLMGDKLLSLAHAYTLSKTTMLNMKQNVFFAVFTVLVLLIGVLFGSVHLASGMFIHELSVLLVILNAMRLMNFHHKRRKKRLK